VIELAKKREPGEVVRLKDASKEAERARKKLLRESRREDKRRANKGCKFWFW